MNAAVEVNQLNVAFGNRRVLENISFRIEAGSAFGIVGPSGCGKSTLLRVLAGLQRQWAGQIRLLDTDITAHRRFAPGLRHAVQMVFQDPYAALHPRHRVGRALLEPLQVLGVGDAQARMTAALARVALSPAVAQRYPHQLSGGERQRIAIARALLPAPDLLLLDEPTSALDLITQAEILNLLTALLDATRLTMVVVSHDMNVIAHLCQEAILLRKGHIEHRLTREDLDQVGAL